MAELESLPDMDIHVPEVKQEPSNFPKMIMIKKQSKPALWHTPEQDFQIAKHVIDPSDMATFDKFIEENIPKDPNVRSTALKFIENVLLAKTTEHESHVFYNDGKNKSFKISFLL